MVRKKKKKQSRKQNVPPFTLPIQQNAMHIVRGNLTNNIISNSVGASVSHDEVYGIVDAILLDYDDRSYDSSNRDGGVIAVVDVDSVAILLCEYMPEMITLEEAESIVRRSVYQTQHDADDESCSSHSHQHTSDNDYEDNIIISHHSEPDDEDMVDGDYIQDGECELCERHMKLTRHHLIPKETWKRIKPRFMDASPHYLSGDFETAAKIMRVGTLPTLSSLHFASPLSIKLFLGNNIAKICRHCHSMVHRFFDNIELAEQYNTVGKLLGDERVYKYCQWANKQKPGKYKC